MYSLFGSFEYTVYQRVIYNLIPPITDALTSIHHQVKIPTFAYTLSINYRRIVTCNSRALKVDSHF